MRRVVIRLEEIMLDDIDRLREEPLLREHAHEPFSRSAAMRALLALGIAMVKDAGDRDEP
jgi:hypothetical protein